MNTHDDSPRSHRGLSRWTQVVLASAVLAVTARSQSQLAELDPAGWPAGDDPTQAIALGDVDGDGDLDALLVATGRTATPGVLLYVNDGTASFRDESATRLPAGTVDAFAVALGDVDRDRDLDVLLLSTVAPGVRLFVNDGTGAFVDGTAARMPLADGSALALGDVDGDGDLDLILPHPVQDQLFVNDGAGHFADAGDRGMPVVAWAGASQVAAADVDGDGDLDLVFAEEYVDRLYLNDGQGSFTDVSAARLPSRPRWSLSLALAVGDVDGDGDVDLVFSQYNRVRGGFGDSPGQNRLLLNDGSGTFAEATSTQMPAAPSFTLSLALGDLDGDGDLDLVAGNSDWSQNGLPVPSNAVWINDGTGRYSDATARFLPARVADDWAVALGDLDADGDLDLICGTTGRDRRYLNLARQLDASTAPRIGRAWTLDAYLRNGRTGSADMAVPAIAFGPASLVLPGLGTLGLDPASTFVLPPVAIPQPGGVGQVTIPVPNQPGLIGTPVYTQALMVPYPLTPRLSNVTADVVH